MALVLALASSACPSDTSLQANVQDAEFFSFPRGAEIGSAIQLSRHVREGAGIWTLDGMVPREDDLRLLVNKSNALPSPFDVSPRMGRWLLEGVGSVASVQDGRLTSPQFAPKSGRGSIYPAPCAPLHIRAGHDSVEPSLRSRLHSSR